MTDDEALRCLKKAYGHYGILGMEKILRAYVEGLRRDECAFDYTLEEAVAAASGKPRS